MFNDILSKYKSGFSDFTILRAQETSVYHVSCGFNDFNLTSFDCDYGVSATVFANGAYGFAALPSYDDESVKRVLEQARKNAIALGKRLPSPLSPVPLAECGSLMDVKGYRKVLPKELLSFEQAICRQVEAAYPKLHASLLISCNTTEKLIVVSNGFDGHHVERATSVDVSLSTNADGDGDGNDRCANKTLLLDKYVCEILDDPSDILAAFDKLSEQLAPYKYEPEDLSNAEFARAGEWDCILMPQFTSMLAHEAVGHTMEADAVIQPGSVGGKYMGKTVASPLVSLTDFHSTVCGGAPGLLDIPVDDEGVKCIDAPIIKNGTLVGAMTDRRTALELGLPMTGNARASKYHDTPIIRMRNTCFHPGTSKLDDMIGAIDFGYFLKRSGGGNGSLKGEFNMNADEIFEIRGGKVGARVKPTTVAGIAWEALQTVDMVSEEFVMDDRCGGCGKEEQGIPTAAGGPAFKMKLTLAGK